MNNTFHIDKHWLRRNFDRAAPHYDAAAALQQEIGQRLFERLELIKLQPEIIVDIGAGTGRQTRLLAQRFPRARTIALDLAPAMLMQARSHLSWWQRWQARQRFICADAEQLPLADQSVDLLFSNVTLQWCETPESVFAEFRRVLRPDGLLLFSTFGPDTLHEMRHSWQAVDPHTHVNMFIDMHDLGDALLRTGLTDPVMDMEMIKLTYPDLRSLMMELKAIGAHNVTSGRPRGLTGPQRLRELTRAYESYRNPIDQRLPASYEVIYGHAWKTEGRPGRQIDGSISVPLSTLQSSRAHDKFTPEERSD
jgi:malonyl-CoA O-methyltransferase